MESVHENTPHLDLHVVDSKFVKSGYPPMTDPYHRIVGINTVGGQVMWEAGAGAEGDYDPPYVRSDATELSIPSNPIFHKRLLSFFMAHLANRRPTAGLEYNCHTFAAAMTGLKLPRNPISTKNAKQTVQDGQVIEQLDHGQVGVIGFHWKKTPYAKHSIVGLGREHPHIIQIVDNGGYLAISSLASAIHSCDLSGNLRRYPAIYKNFGVYVD